MEEIEIQFICDECTSKLIERVDVSIWVIERFCDNCQAHRIFWRDMVISEQIDFRPTAKQKKSVYLFRAENLYKIGVSQNPKRRLRDLSASPVPIELLWSRCFENAQEVESHFHRLFRDKRQRGEWFRLDSDDITFIKEYGSMQYE